MKNKEKLKNKYNFISIKKIFLYIFLFYSLNFLFLLVQPTPTNAELKEIKLMPGVTIPGSEFKKGASTTIGVTSGEGKSKIFTSDLLPRYIVALYNYAVGIVGILAAVVLMIAGIIWMTAAGDSGRVTSAKNLIGGSITGLVLTLCAYIILTQINPALLNFKPIILGSIVGIPSIDKEAADEAAIKIKMSAEKYCGCKSWKSLYNTSNCKDTSQIADTIKNIAPDSPLISYASKISQLSKQYNIDPAILIGKMVVENGLATIHDRIISVRHNVGSISCGYGQKGSNWVCDEKPNKAFRIYKNFDDSIDDYYKVMSNPDGKLQNADSLRQMIATYAPPFENDTQGYINKVMTVVAKCHTDVASDKASARSCDCYNF
jgi:hypothetical protein